MNRKGFTLAELVMAIGIFSFLVLMSMGILYVIKVQTTKSESRNDLLMLLLVVDNVLLNENLCTTVMAGKPFDVAAASAPVLNLNEGQAIDLDLTAPALGGVGILKDNDPVTLSKWGLRIERSRLIGAVLISPSPSGMDPLKKFYSVRYVIKPKISVNNESPSDLKPREITNFVVVTADSNPVTTIERCYIQKFSYRRRCANQGMIFVPLGYGRTAPDDNGCVNMGSFNKGL